MPVFNPNTPELREFLIMASADTRNLSQSIEATATQIQADKAAQAATNASITAAAQTAQTAADTAKASITAANIIANQIANEMVISEEFNLAPSSFTLQASGLYHAVTPLTQIDGTKGVQMSLTDNEGDEQGFSQLISPYMGDSQKVGIELTAGQKNDSSYPLALLCQGRKFGNGFSRFDGRDFWFKLFGNSLLRSVDGGTTYTTWISSGIVEVWFDTINEHVIIENSNGYATSDPSEDTTTPSGLSTQAFDERLSEGLIKIS